MKKTIDRRNFLRSGALVTSTVISASLVNEAFAQDPNIVVVSSQTKNKCATCAFWGGQRTISEDRKSVHVHSSGSCNNKASPMYRTTTSAEHGPMDVWEKWSAID